jgi:hypothetical protein
MCGQEEALIREAERVCEDGFHQIGNLTLVTILLKKSGPGLPDFS